MDIKRKQLNKTVVFWICFSLGFFLLGCGNKEIHHKGGEVVKVTKQDVSSNLFFSGAVDPLKIKAVTSFVSGTIKEMHFEYGQIVQKNQLLFTVHSNRLEETYRSALTSFLQAKNSYFESLNNFKGTQVLYKANIKSREEFNSEKNRLDANHLSYINARYALQEIIKEIPELQNKTDELNLDNVSKIQAMLDRKFDTLKIYSPDYGIALLPKKSSGTDAQEKNIDVGTDIKKGETLISLGDLSGISTIFQVNEIDINRIKVGQKAIVTVPALPGEVFHGVIKSVSAQSKSGYRSGGLATFPVKLVVKAITDKQRELIRMGMNAKIALTIKTEPQLIIPVGAVFEKQGKEMVTLVDPNTRKEKDVPVNLGKTNQQGVSVFSGIKEGDHILVRD